MSRDPLTLSSTTTSGRLRVAVLVAVLAALATACSDADVASPSVVASAGRPSTSSPSSPSAEDPACSPGPDRQIETLPDVTAAAIDQPEAGVTIPAEVIDAGCVIRFDAPGGCLGAVTISGVVIPPVTIPGAEVDGRKYDEVAIPGASAAPVSTPQVCQATVEGDVSGVTRAGVVREGFSRDGGARPGDDDLDTVRVPPLRMPDVDVEPERLESRRLPDVDVDVIAGNGATSYVASSRVLFDSDRAVLRPRALSSLRAIAREINRTAPGARLLVEGHTDNQGSAAHGLDLSERRAAAVADFLVGTAGVLRSLITERGWGERKPAYSNRTEEGRQRNRRVVITVLP